MSFGKKNPAGGSPFFQGLLPVQKSGLTRDIIAGVTLAALGIPEVMGYSKIISMPVVTGLYTVLLPMLVFAILGSSRHLVVGADSATAAIVAAGLATLAIPVDAPAYAESVKAVALIAGAMLLLARIFRVGFIADFMSRTVLIGFLTGVGFQVAFGELPNILGIQKSGHGFIAMLGNTIRHLPQTEWRSLEISLATMAVILLMEKFLPRFPGALLVVAGMILASAGFDWKNHGVSVIGAVPGGLPALEIPSVAWADLLKLLPMSFSCFIVILAQSAATSRAYAIRYRDNFEENRDLVGLSFANFAAGCSNAFIVNGSPTKTAMVDDAGGRSQVSQLATVGVVLLVLLFLTGPLGYLPEAVLATIVLLIGMKLMDFRGLLKIRKARPNEFALAVATAATVVFVGVEQGILLAIVLSLLQHVNKSYQPNTGIIAHDAKEQWRLEEFALNRFIEPGMIMYWFGADLFYANANHFAGEIRKLVKAAGPDLRWLIVDASALTGIDYSASLTLNELQEDLAGQHIVFGFARVTEDLRRDFNHMGLTKAIGEKFLFQSRSSCLQAFREFSNETP